MVCGIYCYKDTQNNNEIVYVGKDSYIDKNTRHKAHHHPSRYGEQVINRILQNNPDRYSYQVLKQGDFDDRLLNALEVIYTVRYDPKFSFTIGGDGTRGYKHSDETKQKCSESKLGEKNPMYGKSFSEEHRERIGNSLSGRKIPLSHRVNVSKSTNTTGYFRVSKSKSKSCKQGFIWKYSYMENKKHKAITNVDLNKLKEKVLAKGLEWREFVGETDAEC